LTGTLTLNALGNPNAVFIFRMGSTITTASASSVVLTNGGSPGNVFWQVGSSATLGTGTSFAGNILAVASITVTTGTSLTGRALALNGAVTLDTNAVTATNPLASAVLTRIGGAETTGSGLSFWDSGTLAARLESGVGTRVLSAADASFAWGNPALLTFGDLNLLGLTNPLASLLPKWLMYGAVAEWTVYPSIAWGTPIQDPKGATIIWGTAEAATIIWGTAEAASKTIIWGTAIMTSPDPQ
jgi:ice-binding like protein